MIVLNVQGRNVTSVLDSLELLTMVFAIASIEGWQLQPIAEKLQNMGAKLNPDDVSAILRHILLMIAPILPPNTSFNMAKPTPEEKIVSKPN